jgi:hypothetical protein
VVESVIKRQALQKLSERQASGKTLLLKSCELRELIFD